MTNVKSGSVTAASSHGDQCNFRYEY